MAPAGPTDKPATVAWPKIFAKSVVFSLTASNPLGADAPAEWNLRANEALEKDILKMEQSRQLSPRAWWRSFGFNAQEGWREEGFSVAFAMEERAYARVAMIKLAHKYRQAAIYAYTHEDGQLMREVLWVDPAKRQAHSSKERMHVLKKAPPSPLAAREWRAAESATGAAADAAAPTPQFAPTGRDTSIWISPTEIGNEVKSWFGK